MRRLLFALVCVAVLAGACSDDAGPDASDDPSTERPESVEPIDVEVAVERYRTVCERTVAADAVQACVDVVDQAIDEAGEHGCSLLALDAFVEHGVAWQFASTPEPGFFEQCPLPLSNLMLPDGPDGYETAEGTVSGTGLLSTPEVAGRYADPDEVGRWLSEIDHAVSYAAAWASGDDFVVTRLDRFGTVEGATAYADFDPLTGEETADIADTEELLTVTGVLQGRVVSSPGTRIATGRVCDVAINVHAQGDDTTMLEVDELVEFFSAQALRIQRVLTCETEAEAED